MRRRDLIKSIGGAAAWPFAARAQQRVMPTVGFLRSTSVAVSTPMIEGFRQGMTAAGFNEGQNVAIEYRYPDNQPQRLPGLVAELIRLPVEVIVANNVASLVAKAATTTVPIVFATGSDLSEGEFDGVFTSIVGRGAKALLVGIPVRATVGRGTIGATLLIMLCSSGTE
jgi:putative tryptophan/tyrosine transport system substrate-binding protein